MDTATPRRYPAAGYPKDRDPRCRTIIPAPARGWPEIALFEWELSAESWTDRHPHSEYNYVIDGKLFVDCAGVTIEAGPGDVVHVPPGLEGRYWTPTHARLLAIYGPCPQGVSPHTDQEPPGTAPA